MDLTLDFYSGAGPCYSLGETKQHTWSLMDETRPRKGIELTYRGGSMCGNVQREIRYHFVCAHGFSKEESVPLFVQENAEPGHVCHYNVTWPSQHGCPIYGTGKPDPALALSHVDLLIYPGLSLILWGSCLGCLGYLGSSLLTGGLSLPAFPKSASTGPRRRVIDNQLPDNFPVEDSSLYDG